MNGSGGSRRGHDSDGQHGDSEGREMPSGRAESDMGERRDDRAGRDGQHALDGAPASGARGPADLSDTGLTAADALPLDLLAVAVRGRAEADSAGEARALEAFRAAREQGPRTGRTRRRDDWRPNPRRRVQLSVRTTLAVLLSSLTLGGVAFAAIGSATRDGDGGGPESEPRNGRTGAAHSAPAAPGPSVTPGADPSTVDRPAGAQDTEAHCRAYEEKADGRGRALDATAWRRLTDAAGGTAEVAAYCAAQLAGAEGGGAAADREERAGDPAGKPDATGRPAGSEAGRKPGDAGEPAAAATGKPDRAEEPATPGTSDRADRQDQADEPTDGKTPGPVDGADKGSGTK